MKLNPKIERHSHWYESLGAKTDDVSKEKLHLGGMILRFVLIAVVDVTLQFHTIQVYHLRVDEEHNEENVSQNAP